MTNQNSQMSPSEILILVCGAALLVNWNLVQNSEHAFGAVQDSPVLAPVSKLAQAQTPVPKFAQAQTPVPKLAQDPPKNMGGAYDNTTIQGESPWTRGAHLLVKHACDQSPQKTGSTDMCRDL